MPQFNYGRLAKRADRIMKRFGYPPMTAFLRRTVDDVTTDRPVTVLEANYRPRERSELIQLKDLRFLVSVVDEVIPPNEHQDVLVIVGQLEDSVEVEYIIKAPPERVAPGGVNVFWQLQCEPK